MEIALLILALVLLLGLNAFFVLAEFAIVKVRPSRVEEMLDAGDPRARSIQAIQASIDEYLGVCQVGITLASVALGIVGTKATDEILGIGEAYRGEIAWWQYALGIGISYLLVSGSHIVLGEQVPKSVAIRVADRAAVFCARPLRISHSVFFPVLWVMTRATHGVLRLLGMNPQAEEPQPSEDELRIILDQSQERGSMSFRRLLFMENVFDFGALSARDAMRPRTAVRCLHVDKPWEENLATIRSSRFTRYPLLGPDPEKPLGFIHLKDLVIHPGQGGAPEHAPPDLQALARPMLSKPEGTPLEGLLAEMQRRRIHLARLTGPDGRWTGLISLEDVIEELIGTIRDEFEDEEPARLSDALAPERIFLQVEADSPVAAVRLALAQMKPEALPVPAEQILKAVEERERAVATYLGDGVGMPHARVPGLQKPFLMILRSEHGVRCAGTQERGRILFVLLTPSGQPRVHQQLQSVIATLVNESEYVRDRLLSAETPAEVLEVVRTGEQAVLD